jgi:hypothetical protein
VAKESYYLYIKKILPMARIGLYLNNYLGGGYKLHLNEKILSKAKTDFYLNNYCGGGYSVPVPLTSALLNLPKGKSLGRSKPATNS